MLESEIKIERLRVIEDAARQVCNEAVWYDRMSGYIVSEQTMRRLSRAIDAKDETQKKGGEDES